MPRMVPFDYLYYLYRFPIYVFWINQFQPIELALIYTLAVNVTK